MANYITVLKQHRFNNPLAATNIFNELVAQHTRPANIQQVRKGALSVATE
jgi:hypothetical protein